MREVVRGRAQLSPTQKRKESQEKVSFPHMSEPSCACLILTAHRLRLLREAPYTQKEAEAAAGLRTDNGTRQTSKTTDAEPESFAMDVVQA